MSEIEATAGAPDTGTAPTSTQEIAASVIQDAERADTATPEGETRLDTTSAVEEKPAPGPKTEPTQAELSAAAKFLEKMGHKAKRKDGQDVWVKVATVENLLDNYVGEHRSTWETEKQTIAQQAKQYSDYLDTLRASVAGDPKAFLSELAGIDPRYKSFLEQQAQQAPQTRQPAPENDPEPQPDYPLGDGRFTYSIEGLAKREAWMRRQIERDLLGKVEERLKPLAEREEQQRQQQAQQELMRDVQARSQSQLQEAQTWPLFGKLADDGSLSEFQQAVLSELQKDSEDAAKAGQRPKLTLEGAYIRIASKRYTEDDAAKRQRLMEEISKAPKSTATPRQATDAPRSAGPRSTQDIARSVIAKLEAGS